MQDTGIVRRIDELGRVVVPKEMRKTLRIREGDPLEIFADKDGLVLKKYSPIKSLDNLAKLVCDCISETTKKDCLITDNDKVVCVSNTKHKEILNNKISHSLIETMKNRKQVFLSKNKGEKMLPVVKEENFDFESQLIIPIISNGDCYGSIILFSFGFSPINEVDKGIMQISATYLAKQFEN